MEQAIFMFVLYGLALLLGIAIGKKMKIILIFALLSSAGSAQVLETAQSLLGKSIGDKMCYAYVSEVLRSSGHTIDTTGMVTVAEPGDVFITYGFYRYKQYPSKYRLTEGIGSHIAIVKKNLGNDCYLILEQNEDGRGSEVSESIINLSEYGFVYSLGYTFVRPHIGAYDDSADNLIRGITFFPTTNERKVGD
jgi:hypothetical protein